MGQSTDLLEIVAKEVVKSSIISSELAERLSKNKDFLNELMKSIDPDVLAKYLAGIMYSYFINGRSSSTHTQDEARQSLLKIIKMAEQKAANTLAQRMADEVITA